MEFINRYTIKARLTFLLIILILLSTTMAFYSFSQIERMALLTQDMYNQPFKVSNSAIMANLYLAKGRSSIKNILLTEDPLAAVKEKMYLEEDQRMIANQLDIIKNNITGEQGKVLEQETKKLYDEWIGLWQEEWFLYNKGNVEGALSVYNNQGKAKAEELQNKTEQLMEYALGIAGQFAEDANSSRERSKLSLILFFAIGIFFYAMIMFLIIGSILNTIIALKKTMNQCSNEGVLTEADIKGNNEISEMASDFNNLVSVLKHNEWVTNGKNKLRHEITEIMNIHDFVDRTLNFIASYTDAGCAVLYTYNESKESLILEGSYAYTERDFLKNECKIGEGVIGQVAKERKPILLKKVKRNEAVILSGTANIKPDSIYAFPLLYENEFLGVIEVLFTYEINASCIEMLDEFSKIIAAFLNNNIQNEKIRILLEEAERARNELIQQSEELQKVNSSLEEQQQILSQQSEELQLTNAQMEEQQQEMQQMNAQLEEQKEALSRQNVSLEEKNSQMNLINRELDNRSEELEKANRYKSELLANMSHELRTPLNSIILLSRLLSSKDDNIFDEKELQKVRVIHKSGVELLRLIDDILDLSKIEAGKMQVNETSFHSSELVSEWNEMFRDVAVEKKLEFSIIDNINTEMHGDYGKLSQIIRNFLSNAFKFTKTGFIRVVFDKEDKDGYNYKIVVKDSGIGIPKEKQNIIFDAFTQANSSITREFGGTGLGLSICKEMAALIGAKILISSEEGKGSEFVVLLPDKFVQAIDESTDVNQIRKNVMPETQIIDDRKCILENDNVILIIEDDKNFAEVIMGVAKQRGFKVVIALDGQAGLELARKYTPMGILLDLGLPDTSGSQILSILKSEKSLSNIPVHIITGTEQGYELDKMGIVGFTTKPIDLSEIENALCKITQFSNSAIRKVLLVEDDENQSEAILELLKGEGIFIKTIKAEADALKELGSQEYCLAIVDLLIENGDGTNICKYVSGMKRKIPVIVYTAKSISLEQEEELRKYTDSIIIKTEGYYERLVDELRILLKTVKNEKPYNLDMKDKLIQVQSKELIGKRILIVDDDSKNVFVLASALENLEVEIGNAHNGQEALDKLRKEKYDLVLMDIMMPVMDGYEAIRQIKEDKILRRIPVIALTAKALKGDREKALQIGADDYISKPLDYDILVRLIHAWISKRIDE